jgi:UDP-N-acetylmuramate dehydrogenase
MLEGFASTLDRAFGRERVIRAAPLGPLTTFKVGGPADLLVEPQSSAEMIAALDAARQHHVPVTMLGGGSNVLVGDRGVRGLVLRPRAGTNAAESTSRVRADAAVTINGLVRWLIARGLAGLEAWAGTPGTVGGGVHGNAHWAGRLLSEHVDDVRLWSGGMVVDVSARDMGFGYDRSRLQGSGEVLLSARFIVTPGDPAALREIARTSLAYRKRTQPLASPSAGCIFQNPMADAAVRAEIPRSAGALVDRAGLKGAREGGAIVSPRHANFIVNDGTATAADIRRLIERCRTAVRDRFGVELLNEIVFVGEF